VDIYIGDIFYLFKFQPLYNQPSDTPVYNENIVGYNEFKTRLLLHFKLKQKERDKRDNYLTKTYAQLSIEWARNIERIENTPKKKAQEAKKRELFEKVFPELRKQREDKERFSRVSRIKSDADLEEIMDGLHEQVSLRHSLVKYYIDPSPVLIYHGNVSITGNGGQKDEKLCCDPTCFTRCQN
jgi:hypothetical protein